MSIPRPPRTWPWDWLGGAWADVRPVAGRGEVALVCQPGAGGECLVRLLEEAMRRHAGMKPQPGQRLVRGAGGIPLHRPPRGLPRIFVTDDGADPLGPHPRRLFAYGWRIQYHRTPVVLLVRDPVGASLALFDGLSLQERRQLGTETAEAFACHPLHGAARAVRLLDIWRSARLVPPRFFQLRAEDLALSGPEALGDLLRFVGVAEVAREHLDEAWAASPFVVPPMEPATRLPANALESCMALVRPLTPVYGYGTTKTQSETR